MKSMPLAGSWQAPRLEVADGSLEALKWLGLLLMTGDHVNKYLFNGTLPWLFEAGRLAMPLFVFVLAWNLARPPALASGAYPRTALRLTLFGLLATPPFIALGGLRDGWYPLNILFTLLVITLATWCFERAAAVRRVELVAALSLVLVGGALVEFCWPAVLLGLAFGGYRRQPGWTALALVIATLAALYLVNRNYWALGVLPLILLAASVDWRVPRGRWLFYAYYPLHLLALWLIRIPMAKAGYLFLI